jgi:adenylylsulfate reductase subunit A
MDEYAGGISQMYGYSEGELKIAELHLRRLEQEFAALTASSLHELLHAHELMDRVTVAQTLVAHMRHRQETRWHCYQERLDYPERDDARWSVFVNSLRKGDKIEMVERPVVRADLEVVLPPLADGAIIRHGSE